MGELDYSPRSMHCTFRWHGLILWNRGIAALVFSHCMFCFTMA
jgi:hypothetical protein